MTPMRIPTLAALALALAAAPAALAQQAAPTVQSIVEALQPEKAGPVVRSLAASGTRGIRIDGPLPAEMDLPQIDLTVNFEFDSDRLTNDAMLTLRALGLALDHPSLAGYRFQVAGHTSAEGSDAYNMDLSQRRVQVVVDHLLSFYPITADRLVGVGYGETQLLYPQIPDSELNRRVTVLNLDPLIN